MMERFTDDLLDMLLLLLLLMLRGQFQVHAIADADSSHTQFYYRAPDL